MPGFLAECLYKDRNRPIWLILKMAREWKIPPTTAVLGGGGTSEWTHRDVLAATALTLLDVETCKSCGTPAWIGHSTDNRVLFRVEEATCHACAELGKAQDDRDRGKNRKKHHGKTFYPTAYNVYKDQPLPSRREEYERRR